MQSSGLLGGLNLAGLHISFVLRGTLALGGNQWEDVVAQVLSLGALAL
jgi:hypothetical protein